MCSPVENTRVSVEPPKYIQGLYLGMLSSAEIIQNWRRMYNECGALVELYCQREIEVMEKEMFHCQFVNHKSHIDLRKSLALKTKRVGFARNVGIYLQNYTMSRYRRHYCTKETGKTRQNRIRQEINV